MKRSERVGTVVRVREIQKRMAETEAVQRRVDATARRADEEAAAALVSHEGQAGVGAAMSFTELSRQRTMVAAAVSVAEDCNRAALLAEEALAEARSAWHAAHRRHDAVDRLLDKTRSSEDAEEARSAQTELDDVVAARQRHLTATDSTQEQP